MQAPRPVGQLSELTGPCAAWALGPFVDSCVELCAAREGLSNH